MHLSQKCHPFKLALIAWSYGLLPGSRIAALGTFMKWRDEIGSVGKNAFLGVFYFMSFSVTLGQASPRPALLLCVFIPVI